VYFPVSKGVFVQPECVIYCRVSSELQTRGHGLQRQLERCIAYASERGYLIAAVFSEVWSGADQLYSRHQAERMARARGCKIVCESYDRWSRRGVEDLPPENLEIASGNHRQAEEDLKKLFTPAQLHMINSRLS
jgi:DNA invertase Pin-like site-specific DNA recombinase